MKRLNQIRWKVLRNRNIKDYMLLIKAIGNTIGNLSEEKQQEHIGKVG
ncbi:MAG: hypothetical protein ACI9JN_000872 [Bacteroidia bacterium]|jgi:hypothetical protein